MLEAAADEIVENGPVNLSLLAVAERAGVSERTLYNHFQTRENLLAELGKYSDRLTEQAGGRSEDSDPMRLPETLRANWASWDAQGNVTKALLLMESAAAQTGRAGDEKARQERHAAIRAGVVSIRPDLDDEQVGALAALIHTLASGRTWYRMTSEFGVESEAAATVAAWAYETLREALRADRSPFDD